MSFDALRFREFEHAGWERVARRYETCWADLTRGFIAALLDAVEAGSGTRLLDVACGPGYASGTARQLGCDPVGIDFSSEMIGQARRHRPDLEFLEADAERLPFSSGSFDAVVMNFGVLHLSNPDMAFTEARRVLRPGGRFAFTAWAKPEINPGVKIVSDAIEAHADMTVELPQGPPYFRFSEPIECLRSLDLAGFSAATVSFATVTSRWKIPNPVFLFDAERDAGVRTAALLARQTPERLSAIRSAIESGVARYADGAGYALPMAAHLVAATAGG